MSKIVYRAITFAMGRHSGQLDDEGIDYFSAHLEPVKKAIEMLTSNETIIAAAVLHDTLEDTDTTYQELKKLFGVKVADLVKEVTHKGKADNHGYYFPNLKSPEAIMIKLVDRASNISRMHKWNEKRKKQYLKNTKFWRAS